MLFRFFFIWFLLQIAPWGWLEPIRACPSCPVLVPGRQLGGARRQRAHLPCPRPSVAFTAAATHPTAGLLWLFLTLAALGAVIWSALTASGPATNAALLAPHHHPYYLASAALSYGIIKLLATQMAFPS